VKFEAAIVVYRFYLREREIVKKTGTPGKIFENSLTAKTLCICRGESAIAARALPAQFRGGLFIAFSFETVAFAFSSDWESGAC
jgi:hypothetical protein